MVAMIASLSWFMRFRLIKPLKEIVSAFAKANFKNPELIRFPISLNQRDELTTLADAGNRFLDTLEDHLSERQNVGDQLLRAKNEADLANRAKTNFLSTMSHEIRTPLNGVLGLAQLLRASKLDNKQLQKVDTILTSGNALLDIINDVLDMSKIEAGSLELESKSFNLEQLISSATMAFQSLADEKDIQIQINDEREYKPILVGDAVRLKQILWNLLSNAIKFTEKGFITLNIIEIKENHMTPLVEKPYGIYLSVSDTGAGISVDRIDAIFDAFTQEDNTISRKHGGTGLGLSIVKRLVELMGGSIDVESQLGVGTTFNVCLPLDVDADQEPLEAPLIGLENTRQKVEPLNVLIAEDNHVNALIVCAFLENEGHYVQHVENGHLALEASKEGWADIILMDVHMPEMNGIEATKAIRRVEMLKDIPIIGLTADAFSEQHTLFREAGMNDVLTKPYTEQQLSEVLNTYRSG